MEVVRLLHPVLGWLLLLGRIAMSIWALTLLSAVAGWITWGGLRIVGRVGKTST